MSTYSSSPVLLLSIIICAFLLLLFTRLERGTSSNLKTNRNSRNLEIKWAETFGGVTSDSLNMSCSMEGRPVCCSILDQDYNSAWVDENRLKVSIAKKRTKHDLRVEFDRESSAIVCTDTRVYHPSPYQLKQIEFAKKLETDFHAPSEESAQKLVEFISSAEAIRESKLWLERVKYHMLNIAAVSSADDEYILSKFVVTRTCYDRKASIHTEANITNSWVEWIEPLSVHGRHPNSMQDCSTFKKHYSKNSNNTLPPAVSIMHIDYILVQNGEAFHNHSHPNSALVKSMQQRQSLPVRHYLLDAGTSTFDSSLVFFLCMYAERMISFEQIYGWEYSLLEPEKFWRKVPWIFTAIYHFFNVPAQAEVKELNSPLRIIKSVARKEDFVAFKLDIDAPHIEIPMAQTLLDRPDLFELVDEFFFEYHFQCEIMSACGWGNNVGGANRVGVMKMFSDFRHKGVRSHFWP